MTSKVVLLFLFISFFIHSRSADYAEVIVIWEGTTQREIEVDGNFMNLEPRDYRILQLPIAVPITIAVDTESGFVVLKDILKIQPGYGELRITYLNRSIQFTYLSFWSGKRIKYENDRASSDNYFEILTNHRNKISDVGITDFTHAKYRNGLDEMLKSLAEAALRIQPDFDGTVFCGFEIDTYGRAVNVHIYSDIDHRIKNGLRSKISDMRWIGGLYKPDQQDLTANLQCVAVDCGLLSSEILLDVDVNDEIEFIEEVEEEIVEEQIFTIAEEMPSFPGGDAALMKYLGKNTKYPAIAKDAGIQGTVYVTFVLNEDGSVTDVKVLRSIGGGCDEEAIRVVKSMPKWQPGKQNGKNVKVQYNLPIRFTKRDYYENSR